MSLRSAEISFPAENGELEIVALSVAAELGPRGFAVTLRDDGSDGCGIRIGDAAVSLRWDSAKASLIDRDWPLVLKPALHPSLFVRTASPFPRICFRTDPPSRRMRMMAKAIRELRRRGRADVVCAIGASEEEWPDECYPELTGREILRLLALCRCYVDAASEHDPPQLLSAIAVAAGVPVITSASHRWPGAPNVIPVVEWSADAFCDALMFATPVVREVNPAPIATAVDTLLRSMLLA